MEVEWEYMVDNGKLFVISLIYNYESFSSTMKGHSISSTLHPLLISCLLLTPILLLSLQTVVGKLNSYHLSLSTSTSDMTT